MHYFSLTLTMLSLSLSYYPLCRTPPPPCFFFLLLALIAHNPHAARPTRSDLAPPPPGHVPTFPTFSSSSFQRKTPAPSPALPTSEPISSQAGQFTLSLKGVRQLLRKRGRRAEVVVKLVEEELRSWAGFGDDAEDASKFAVGNGYGQPRIVDSTPVPIKSEATRSAKSGNNKSDLVAQGTHTDTQDAITSLQTDASASSSPSTATKPSAPAPPAVSSRSLPAAFTTTPTSSPAFLTSLLESFYSSSASSAVAATRPAIVELVRAPGHLVWAISDGFERLIVHLLARYYELISFSQTLPSIPTSSSSTSTSSSASASASNKTTTGYRITHILLPSVLKPSPTTTMTINHGAHAGSGAQGNGNDSHLWTPENTDIDTDSASASSGLSDHLETSGSEIDSGSEYDMRSRNVDVESGSASGSETETETENDRSPAVPRINQGRGREFILVPSGGRSLAGRDRSVGSESEWSDLGLDNGIAGSGFQDPDQSPNTIIAASGPAFSITRERALHSDSDADFDADADDSDAASNSSFAASSDHGSQWGDDPLLVDPISRVATAANHNAEANANANPFISEFDLPIIDLFPSARDRLGSGNGRVNKASFFEFLYG